jgi:hypothetical protein
LRKRNVALGSPAGFDFGQNKQKAGATCAGLSIALGGTALLAFDEKPQGQKSALSYTVNAHAQAEGYVAARAAGTQAGVPVLLRP